MGEDPAYHSIPAAFGNCSASEALVIGGFAALVVAFLLFVPRGVVKFRAFMDGIVEGVKSMVPAFVILILAWTISGVCRELLMTGEFVKNHRFQQRAPGALLPALIFIVSALLSLRHGNSLGTFGILIPIVVPTCTAVAPELLVVALSATLAGSVFGDHCSPISDTTILSSTGAGCNHIQHVSTQLVYFRHGSRLLRRRLSGGRLLRRQHSPTLGTSLLLLAAVMFILHRISRVRNAERSGGTDTIPADGE